MVPHVAKVIHHICPIPISQNRVEQTVNHSTQVSDQLKHPEKGCSSNEITKPAKKTLRDSSESEHMAGTVEGM